MGPRIARLRAHEATRANAKQQAEATKSSKEVAEQKPAISPSLSQKEAATSQSTGATASIAPLTGVGNAEDAILDKFKGFAQLERQKIQDQRDAWQASSRAARLTELLRFSESFKLNTPVPNDLVGILSKDPDKQAQISDKARREAKEQNPVTASSDPVGDKMFHTEAPLELIQIVESPYASTSQQVSPPGTIRERPVVRMPLADQSNSQHGITQRQMLHENYLDSLRTQLQTLEALTANGQDPTTDQPKSVSKPPEHRPKTWAELIANHGKQAPTTEQRNSISGPRKEAAPVNAADITSVQYIDQKPKPRRRKMRGNKKG